MTPCPGCGAVWFAPDESCAARFDALLALDHSRREPWGSRHGLAFSAFGLQHPDRHGRDVLERAWLMLYAVYVNGSDREAVARGLRRGGKDAPAWDATPLPAGAPPSFTVTIADLGAFDAGSYPERLDAWCRATLDAWQALAQGSTPADM